MSDGEWGPAGQANPPAAERLDSWKEIAGYLRRDERTARRWAETAGLPVRRVQGQGRRPVFAYQHELEEWLRQRPAGGDEPAQAQPPLARPVARPARSAGWRWGLGAAAALVVLAAGYYFATNRPQSPAGRSTAAIRSLAVLPLANLSGDPHQDYIAEALTDELITNLAQIPNLRVISRTSVLNYEGRRISLAQVGRELHVEAVVEGSVARAGQRVRLNAQLIYIPGDRQLWAKHLEGQAGNLVAVEDQLAAVVAANIEKVIAGKVIAPEPVAPNAPEPAVDAAAYDEYLHGLYWLDRRDEAALVRARDAFVQATRQAPGFAPGYAGLAQAEALLGDYQLLDPREAFPRAQAAAQRALALDGRLSGAHAVLAFVIWRYRWDRHAAAAEFARALELDPNNATAHEWHGMYLAAGGETAAAEKEFRQAVQLDPLSRIAHVNLGTAAYYAGRLDLAIRRYRSALALAPDFGPGHVKLWLAYACAGKGALARDELKTVLRLYAGGDRRRLAALDRGYQEAGQRGMVRAYLAMRRRDAEKSYVSPYGLAVLAALAGERDQAFRWLHRALQERDSWLVYARVDPALAGLRRDPRWGALLRQIRPA
ncbi:MAG: TPR end-of-group domain-containing protein [Terriglobales bacterium]